MPYTLQFAGREINGDSHAKYYTPLWMVGEKAGWRLREVREIIQVVPVPALGLTDFLNNEILVSGLVPSNMKVRVLAHELGHALVGRPDLVWPNLKGTDRILFSETVAESVALRVCRGIGLDVLDVAGGYLSQFPTARVKEALAQERHRICKTADRILSEI